MLLLKLTASRRLTPTPYEPADRLRQQPAYVFLNVHNWQPMTQYLSHSFLRVNLVGLMLVLASNAALAGIRTDAPPRVDAFVGVMSRQQLAPGDPQALANPKVLRVALLLSENTKKHLAWCEQQTSGVGSVDRAFVTLFAGSKGMTDSDRAHMLAYDPKFVTDGVTRPLVQRFKSLKLVNSLEEFRQSGFDVLALVDVSFVNTFNDGFIIGSRYETGTFINVYFIDAQGGQLLGKVEANELKEVERETFLQSVALTRSNVMARYESSLTDTLGPVPTTTVVAPAVTAPAEPARSVQERLKALDELVKQGLLTPGEAAAKRVEILKAL